MAERQLYNQEFNSVAIPQGRMQEAQAISGAVEKVGISLIQNQEKQDELKMTKFSSEAEQQILKKTEEIRLKHIDNPTSPKAQQDFDREYTKIFGEYNKEFSRFSVGKWNALRDNSKLQFNVANQKWAMAQNAKNAQTNLNSGIETALQTSYGLGSIGDIDGALVSAKNKEAELRAAVSGILPENKINEDMKTFQSDYMKNFVLGVAEKNPEQAFALLENEKVTKILNNQEIHDTLKKVVSVNQAKAEIGLYRTQIQNHAKYDTEAKDLNVGQQLSKLQAGAKSGEYRDKWAESKEAVILSTKKISAVTQVEKHGEFLTRKEDILTMYEEGEIDDKEYLRQVNQFEIDMNKSIAKGEIREYDAEKTLNSMRQKLGSATTNIQGQGGLGFTEKKAYKSFEKDLPVMYRNKAKRDFFNAIDGKDLDEKGRKAEYAKILEGYKTTAIEEQSVQVEAKDENIKTIRGKKFKKIEGGAWQAL